MNRLELIGVLAFAAVAAPAFAAPTPIPTALLGTHYITFDSQSFPSANLLGPFPAGYGGAFKASIYTNTTSATPAPGFRTTVWCVDYQLDVSTNSTYTSDIIRLSDITTLTDARVRYGNLTNSTSPPSQHWANPLTPVNAYGFNTDTAKYRYTLAAALLTQLTSNAANTILAPDNPINNAHNQAIQTAIWYLTYNTDYQPAASWPAFALPSGVTAAAVNTWVKWAEDNVTSVNLAGWAVISGPANAAGLLLPPTSGVYQTFLVQVVPTPEPAFYGSLAIGLTGMLLAVRRRRASRATTN